MKSKKNGASTSVVEVLNISPHGFWLLLYEQEYFLAFDHFPWFRHAPISAILNVQLPHPHHLHWPELDVDLELDAIVSPEKYPLVDKAGLALPSAQRAQLPKRKSTRALLHH